jgi:hypothetical protein
METYLFIGRVLPERAALSVEKFGARLDYIQNGVPRRCVVRVRILVNQIAVWFRSYDAWHLPGLRNVVAEMLQAELSRIGYFTGHAYDFEITRVINVERNDDLVFGIDTPAIAGRLGIVDLQAHFVPLRKLSTGLHARLLDRCFNDLASALRHPADRAFYCYRAIESLSHHCGTLKEVVFGERDDARRWELFRDTAGCSRDDVMAIKREADDPRHGRASSVKYGGDDDLLSSTWSVVDKYLSAIGYRVAGAAPALGAAGHNPGTLQR